MSFYAIFLEQTEKIGNKWRKQRVNRNKLKVAERLTFNYHIFE